MPYVLMRPQEGKREVKLELFDESNYKYIDSKSSSRGDIFERKFDSIIDIVLFNEKNRKTPDIFFAIGEAYLVCNEVGRLFFEKHAKSAVQFTRIKAYHGIGDFKWGKGRPGSLIDEPYYFIDTLVRLDSIDWQKSSALKYEGFICSARNIDPNVPELQTWVDWPVGRIDENQKYVPGGIARGVWLEQNRWLGHQIWREDMDGYARAKAIFVSDKFMNQMKSELKCALHFMPTLDQASHFSC